MSFADRILASFEALTKAFTSKLTTSIVWEYSVAEVTETTFSGRKTSKDNPHDDFVKIPLMPGIAGTLIKPAVGSLVGVLFLNGDPAKPRVVCWDQTVPVSIGLAGGGPAVHRVGDAGEGGTFTAATPPATLLYTGPDGLGWIITLAAGMVPVTGVVAPFPAAPSLSPGKVVTKATAGSGKVTSG